MQKIKTACVGVWGEYLWLCDETRRDEALAIVGALAVALVGLWLACNVLCILMAGQEVYGVPLLAVALWTRARH